MFQEVRSAEGEVGGRLLRNQQKNSEKRGLDAGEEPPRNVNPRWKSRDKVGQCKYNLYSAHFSVSYQK